MLELPLPLTKPRPLYFYILLRVHFLHYEEALLHLEDAKSRILALFRAHAPQFRIAKPQSQLP